MGGRHSGTDVRCDRWRHVHSGTSRRGLLIGAAALTMLLVGCGGKSKPETEASLSTSASTAATQATASPASSPTELSAAPTPTETAASTEAEPRVVAGSLREVVARLPEEEIDNSEDVRRLGGKLYLKTDSSLWALNIVEGDHTLSLVEDPFFGTLIRDSAPLLVQSGSTLSTLPGGDVYQAADQIYSVLDLAPTANELVVADRSGALVRLDGTTFEVKAQTVIAGATDVRRAGDRLVVKEQQSATLRILDLATLATLGEVQLPDDNIVLSSTEDNGSVVVMTSSELYVIDETATSNLIGEWCPSASCNLNDILDIGYGAAWLSTGSTLLGVRLSDATTIEIRPSDADITVTGAQAVNDNEMYVTWNNYDVGGSEIGLLDITTD